MAELNKTKIISFILLVALISNLLMMPEIPVVEAAEPVYPTLIDLTSLNLNVSTDWRQNPHAVSLVKTDHLNDYTYWMYIYSWNATDSGIGLARSNFLTTGWVWESDAKCIPQGSERPTVYRFSDTHFEMFVRNASAGNHMYRWSSVDGINWVQEEEVVDPITNELSTNEDLHFYDGNFYLYYQGRLPAEGAVSTRLRISASIEDLDEASYIEVLAAGLKPSIEFPSVSYFDGIYWLIMEDRDNSESKWQLDAWYSTSPTGPFVEYSENPLLRDESHIACMFQYVDGDKIYVYVSRYNADVGYWNMYVTENVVPTYSYPLLNEEPIHLNLNVSTDWRANPHSISIVETNNLGGYKYWGYVYSWNATDKGIGLVRSNSLTDGWLWYNSYSDSWEISYQSDDCFIRRVGEYFSYSRVDLDFGDYSSGGYDYETGLNFYGVDIPQGATIVSAYITLVARTLQGVIPTLIFEGEDIDSSPTFDDAADYTGRDGGRTGASVNWTPSAWVVNSAYQSPNLKTIVQEVVDRPGWSTDNNMTFFLSHALGWGGVECLLTAYSFDDVTYDAPLLTVVWTHDSPRLIEDVERATVYRISDSHFEMFVRNITENHMDRYNSTDGINWVWREQIVDPITGELATNEDIKKFGDDYYLYYSGRLPSETHVTIRVRQNSSITDLGSLDYIELLDGGNVKTALEFPSVEYFNGLYWLLCEDRENDDSEWQVDAWVSESPTGPFVEVDNNPVLYIGDETTREIACPLQYVEDHRMYVFNSIFDGSIWDLGVDVSVDAQIIGMEGDGWVIVGEEYLFDMRARPRDSYDLETVTIAFYDGLHWINVTYDHEALTNQVTLDIGSEYVNLGYDVVSTSGTEIRILFYLYFDTPILDAYDIELWVRYSDTSGVIAEWIEERTDYFSIFDLGVTVEVTSNGDGSRTLGGGMFDLMAENSTLDSWVRADSYEHNFQHLRTQVQLWQGSIWNGTGEYFDCITEHSETGYVEYGVDYYFDGEWVVGWKVQLEILAGSAGTFGAGADEAYVTVNASWYNRGELVKSDLVVAMYEAYTPSDLSRRLTLFVDLWIDEEEGSRTVAGRVSSKYFGMSETGWWLWADWGPVYGTLTSSIFKDPLQSAGNASIQAVHLNIFRVYSKLAKTSQGVDTDCDDDLWYTVNIAPDIVTLPSRMELSGIKSPAFMDTTTPDMPLGYFPSLADSLIAVLLRIEDTLVTGGLSAGSYIYGLATGTIDAAMSAGLGIDDFTATVTALANSFGAFVSDSVGYAVSLITMVFGLFASIATFIVTWMGNFISMILQISVIVQGILDGTYEITTGLGSIWTLIDLDEWIEAVPLFMVLGWFTSIDRRARRSGSWMGTFWGDVSMMMAVISFIFDMSMRVISLIIDWAARFATFILPI